MAALASQVPFVGQVVWPNNIPELPELADQSRSDLIGDARVESPEGRRAPPSAPLPSTALPPAQSTLEPRAVALRDLEVELQRISTDVSAEKASADTRWV